MVAIAILLIFNPLNIWMINYPKLMSYVYIQSSILFLASDLLILSGHLASVLKWIYSKVLKCQNQALHAFVPPIALHVARNQVSAEWVSDWLHVSHSHSWTHFTKCLFGLGMVPSNKNRYRTRRMDLLSISFLPNGKLLPLFSNTSISLTPESLSSLEMQIWP